MLVSIYREQAKRFRARTRILMVGYECKFQSRTLIIEPTFIYPNIGHICYHGPTQHLACASSEIIIAQAALGLGLESRFQV
jgi:hypothetical protein